MDITIKLTQDTAESLVAFIKMHEREDIPDEVWCFCLDLQDEADIW